ncbi:MAG: hypothetical protein HYY30_03640 [Chloroflexi bacterium]|nr:hypothetical protein [Chloroflexota bacterium]
MQFSTPQFNFAEPTTTIFRFLTVGLAAIALVLSGHPIDQRLAPVVIAYLITTVVLWLLAPRVSWTWLIYPTSLMDVVVVTAIISLSIGSPLALWSLYLFPLASTAATGRVPALASAVLSIFSYLSTIWLNTSTVSVLAIWQATVLVAVTALITILTHRWMVERQEKRAWQEIAAAARGLIGDKESDIAATVAERARRLVRADMACIWSWDQYGRLHSGVQVGKASEEPILRFEPHPALMHKLDRGTVSIDELGEPFVNRVGEAISLQREKERVALLAVGWNRPPRDLAAQQQRLRLFAPWALDALTRAQAMAASREELRRRTVLECAVRELARPLERPEAQEILVQAARKGLDAVASLVERSSGHVLTGDAEVTEALVRLSVTGEANDVESDKRSATQLDTGAPLIAPIEENVVLVAWRTGRRFGALDLAWLNQLADVGQVALRRCAEHERLQAEERVLRAGLEALPAPVVIWNTCGATVFANGAYLALGLKAVPRVEPLSIGAHEAEVVIGKSQRVLMAVTVPVAGEQLAITHFREITREREALRAKDELIAMVGHELRTPLTSIYGYSQMMARHLAVVQQQVDQVNRLIGDFVEAAKLDSGQLPLCRQMVDMVQLARSAAERFRGAYPGRRLQLETSSIANVEGDPVRLGQVFDNLLGNAVKYSPADREIVLTVELEGGQVVVSVQDQGIGIAPEHLSRLFDRFFRVPNEDTDHVKGSGLGLSIVRDIVTAHGGRVWAASKGRGLGSTFHVSLVPAATDRGSTRLEARRAS